MKFWRRLAELREANARAARENNEVLQKAETDHETALAMRDVADEQAGKLKSADRRNHYSESLTQSFRGRTA
jgi:hypothetical protein